MTPTPPTIQRPFYEPWLARHFPAWHRDREHARLGAVEASFRGGVATRTSEYWGRESGFRFGSGVDRANLMSARDRAYQAWENNPIAKAIVGIETDNVIGDGLNYQPASKSKDWNREAVDRYYKWLETASVRGPDIEGGCEIERNLWAQSRVAGDIGWILVSRGPESLIQIVPAENIVTPDEFLNEPNVYDGIRFDAQGRPVTYYVYFPDDRGLAKRTFTPVGYRDFVFLPHFSGRANAARGKTCFLTIFDHLAHLDRYIDGVSLAAWMATVFGLIFKNTSAGSAVSALDSYATDSQGVERRAVTFENGMVKYVGTDEEVAQVQAHQPMQQTPEFIRAMLRLIGEPFQMPLEVLALDMSTVTFASARIGLLPFYRNCRIKASRFASRWGRTIFWWLSRERQRTRDDPKRWRTAFPEDYGEMNLLPNAWDYTDPVTEAQSDQLQHDMKTKSPQMTIAERGRDVDQILRDLEEWQKLTANLPQSHSTLTREPQPEPAEPAAPPRESEAARESARAMASMATTLTTIAERPIPPAQVNVQPAAVNVTVPEQAAPVVNIEPAQVNVTVPEQPAPVVNVEPAQIHVDAPEINVPAPQVTVNVPPPKATVKSVTRDKSGRITRIREEPE